MTSCAGMTGDNEGFAIDHCLNEREQCNYATGGLRALTDACLLQVVAALSWPSERAADCETHQGQSRQRIGILVV